jgi:hypothetical protein
MVCLALAGTCEPALVLPLLLQAAITSASTVPAEIAASADAGLFLAASSLWLTPLHVD